MMVCRDGMATRTHRTTFTLDAETIRRLKRLAARWDVSQAEVVRRAIAQAETLPQSHRSDPVSMLRELQESSEAIDPKEADSYLSQVYTGRRS